MRLQHTQRVATTVALLTATGGTFAPRSDAQPASLIIETIGGVGTTDGELNYCSDIQKDTDYQGAAIDFRYDNFSNHWYPATVSTCCASCRNSRTDPHSPHVCACWVFGHSEECRHERFEEGEGCCWLKRADDNGGKCKLGRIKSKNTIAGFFVNELHEGGLPGDEEYGWYLVCGILAVVFAGFSYSRAVAGTTFGQTLKGLVGDGLAFTLRGGRSGRIKQPASPVASQPDETTPLTLPALRGELESMGLSTSGTMKDLKTRLAQAKREAGFSQFLATAQDEWQRHAELTVEQKAAAAFAAQAQAQRETDVLEADAAERLAAEQAAAAAAHAKAAKEAAALAQKARDEARARAAEEAARTAEILAELARKNHLRRQQQREQAAKMAIACAEAEVAWEKAALKLQARRAQEEARVEAERQNERTKLEAQRKQAEEAAAAAAAEKKAAEAAAVAEAEAKSAQEAAAAAKAAADAAATAKAEAKAQEAAAAAVVAKKAHTRRQQQRDASTRASQAAAQAQAKRDTEQKKEQAQRKAAEKKEKQQCERELAALQADETRLAKEMARQQQLEVEARQVRKVPLSYRDPRLDDSRYVQTDAHLGDEL